jgi:hypothetical protein
LFCLRFFFGAILFYFIFGCFPFRVQKAYRNDEMDPRFVNPMLPQWTKLLKEITVSRIKRKRTAEIGRR